LNILLINHYAGGPALGMEYRPYYLAREWVRAGHRVMIVAADFSHVRASQPRAGDEAIDGIAYRWLPTPRYRGNGLARLRNVASFLRRVWAQAPRLAATFRPDVVIGSSTYPMDCWVAQRIARLAGATLVHEVHDLWPLSPIELSGMSKWHPFALLCQAAENSAYRRADVVVSMLPKVHSHMAAHGLDLARLVIVPNGISPDDWKGDSSSDRPGDRQANAQALRADVQQAMADAHAAGQAVVGYAGSMGEPNVLDTLLDAAALLRDAPLRFVLVGDGHLREHLAARIAAERLSQLSLLPPVPRAQVPPLLAQFDIAFIGWQPMPIYRFGIAPNKLMDYMMAGCAVLHSVDAGNDPVAESGCGLSVAPGDARALAAGLKHLAALPAAERRAMGRKGRLFVQAHHTYPVLAQRFLDAVHAARRP
jgi:glycosyltransferase involved in cell wall biosynthesis